MAKPRLPRYCLHKSTGRAYVRLPTRPKATVVYLGPYGSPESRRRYDEEVAKWLGGGRTADGPAPSRGPTVAEVADAYLSHARSYYRKRGEETSQVGLIRATMEALKEAAGRAAAADFDAARLKLFRGSVVASGLTRGGVNRRVRLVKQCLAWAVEEGRIPPAGWHSCLAVRSLRRDRTPAAEAAPVKPVALEVVEATLPHLPRPVAAMVRLQLLTGMRPDEACQMGPGMIERAPGAIWVYRPDRHKTEHHGHRRAIPLGPRARELVEAWADWGRPDAPMFSPAAWMAERRVARRAARKSKVQPSQVDRRKPAGAAALPGDRYDAKTYRQAVARAAKAAGQPHWHPNQLRHTYGTLVRARYGLDASQVLLGHANADVTEVYAERDLAKASEIAAEIG